MRSPSNGSPKKSSTCDCFIGGETPRDVRQGRPAYCYGGIPGPWYDQAVSLAYRKGTTDGTPV